ncbi:uncharacterized protein LOC123884851 [Trifolium pratense]|uniref:uncharacterized protein LOC123884851 n=1 Tax=Trifolium pratense TaxID=57577 RepID=UPI001E6954B4|nr:uncharacterized protein LOC123884851 [Trifolium pratense]XP_045790041.1 uncharacterized protein LOC123884851 [Trifolium pratense]
MNNETGNQGGNSTEISTNVEPKQGWKKVLLEQVVNWMTHKNKDKWLKDMKGNLSLVATIIATMTFQTALNPPGGVRPVKDDKGKNPDDIACTRENNILKLCPGNAVLAVIYSDEYEEFLRWNTVCFIASLSVLLLLVSGIRLDHRFPMWVLSMGMCFTLTSLVITYIKAVQLVTPDPVWDPAKNFQKKCTHAWIGLMTFLALLLTLRLIIWAFFIKKGKILAISTPKSKDCKGEYSTNF